MKTIYNLIWMMLILLIFSGCTKTQVQNVEIDIGNTDECESYKPTSVTISCSELPQGDFDTRNCDIIIRGTAPYYRGEERIIFGPVEGQHVQNQYFDLKPIKENGVNIPYNDYVLNKTREFRRRIGFNSFLINLGINTKRRSLESISKIFNEMGVLDSPDITETEKIIKGFCGQQLYYGNGTLGFEIYTNKKGKKIIKITNPAYSKINIFKEALTPLSFKGRYSFNSEPCLF